MQKLSTRRRALCAALAALFLFALAAAAPRAQGTGSILYGDLRVDESKAEGPVPLAYDIILYGQNGSLINRQTVPNGGGVSVLCFLEGCGEAGRGGGA